MKQHQNKSNKLRKQLRQTKNQINYEIPIRKNENYT